MRTNYSTMMPVILCDSTVSFWPTSWCPMHATIREESRQLPVDRIHSYYATKPFSAYQYTFTASITKQYTPPLLFWQSLQWLAYGHWCWRPFSIVNIRLPCLACKSHFNTWLCQAKWSGLSTDTMLIGTICVFWYLCAVKI